MEQVQPRLTVGDVFGYALAYMCWLVTAAIAMLAVFQTRNMINVMWPVLGGNQWVLRAIDRFGLLFLGLVWLVFVIFVEQHFRTAITYVRERRHKAEHVPKGGAAIQPRCGQARAACWPTPRSTSSFPRAPRRVFGK